MKTIDPCLKTVIITLVMMLICGACFAQAEVTGRSATYTVAAYNASPQFQEQADLLCGSQDNQEEINAFIQWLGMLMEGPRGARIVFSEGDFYCSDSIIAENMHLTFQGQGTGATRLHFSQSDGFVWSTGRKHKYQLNLRDLSIFTSFQGNFDAVRASGPNPGAGCYKMVYLNNLEIGGEVPQGGALEGYWKNGIVLDNCVESQIGAIHIMGRHNSVGFNSTEYGILIKGWSMNDKIDDVKIVNVGTGICMTEEEPDDNIEGIRIYNPVIFSCKGGIYWNTRNVNPSGSLQGGPDLQIHGGHLDCVFFGVNALNLHQSYIDGTLIYGRDYQSTEFAGIQILGDHSVFTRIHGVHICKNGSQALSYGILLDSPNSSIMGNVFQNIAIPVYLKSQSVCCTVIGNTATEPNEGIVNGSPTNIIEHNCGMRTH